MKNLIMIIEYLLTSQRALHKLFGIFLTFYAVDSVVMLIVFFINQKHYENL